MYTTDVLVPFNLIVDTDMGLIKLLEFDYSNTEYFHEGILNTEEENQQYLLNTRNNRNPLSIVFKKDDPELMDDLYKQFIEKEYDNILQLSCNTSLANLANALREDISQVIRLTILCQSKAEENIIKLRNIPHFRPLVSRPELVNLNNYDSLYIKDVHDLDKFKKEIFKKSIYVANYGFNIVIDPEQVNPLIDPETAYTYGGVNEFFVVSVYQFDPNKIPLD